MDEIVVGAFRAVPENRVVAIAASNDVMALEVRSVIAFGAVRANQVVIVAAVYLIVADRPTTIPFDAIRTCAAENSIIPLATIGDEGFRYQTARIDPVVSLEPVNHDVTRHPGNFGNVSIRLSP